MALKNMSEFTDEIIALIYDAKEIQIKVEKLKNVVRFKSMDVVNANAKRIEQTLTDLFGIDKPIKKKAKK